MNLIPEKLERVAKTDYTKCREVQDFIQQLVDRDDLIAWSQREEPVVVMSLPEKKHTYKFLSFITP